MIDVKQIAKPRNSGSGGASPGGGSYGSIGKMAEEAKHAAKADIATHAEQAEYANRAGYASRAAYANRAYDLTEDSPVNDRFLSKIAADIAQGYITFQQGLTAIGLAVFKDGAHFGEFVKSLYAGKGAGIDAQGNAEVESLRVRSYFECLELIVNRLSAIEGDQLLTEADTIESVDDLGNGCFGLHLKSKWDGYFTAQAENNVLKGIINTLAQGSGKYYTAWFRVNSVNTANNYIEVTQYPDTEVPSGKNHPPCEMMKIARWGNQTDTKRQDCLYLSSTEGRIVKLKGVTKPILDNANYGAAFGSLPEFVYELLDDNGNPLPIRDGLDTGYRHNGRYQT